MKKFVKFGAVLTAMVLSCFVSCGGGDSGGDVGSGGTVSVSALQGLWMENGKSNGMYFVGDKVYTAIKKDDKYYYIDKNVNFNEHKFDKSVTDCSMTYSLSGNLLTVTTGSKTETNRISLRNNKLTIYEEGYEIIFNKVNVTPEKFSTLAEDKQKELYPEAESN